MILETKVDHPNIELEELNELIIDSIQDIKGRQIVKLDLRELEEAPTDFFIICEGDSNTQVKAISDNIYRRLKQEAGVLPNHTEGEKNALWICLDYFNVVVHIFYRETRSFYELEALWSDAKFTEYETLQSRLTLWQKNRSDFVQKQVNWSIFCNENAARPF